VRAQANRSASSWSDCSGTPVDGYDCSHADLPLGDARDRFSALVTSVQQTHDRVTVTRNGVPAAVIVSPADLEELEETIAVLSSPALMRQLAESREDVQRRDLLDATEDRESLIASIKSRAGR
jgi:prevent-host-death family protein